MTRRLPALLLTLAALALPSGAAAQTVLILDDTTTEYEAQTAAENLGFEVTTSRNIAGFLAGYETREEWDLLVLDVSRLVFTPTLLEPVEAHLAAGGAAIISHHNVGGNTPLRDALDLDCSGNPSEIVIASTPADGYDLFTFSETFPSPISGVARYGDNGDNCEARGEGLVLGRVGATDGPPSIVTSRDNQVLYNGIVFDSLRATAAADRDADEDGVDDVVELLMNEMLVLLDLQTPGIVVYGDAPTPEVDRLAVELDIEVLHAATLEDLDLLIADDSYYAAYFAFSDLAAADPEVQSRIDGFRATGTPVLFFASDFDADTTWPAYFDLAAAGADSDTPTPIGPGTTALENVLFSFPNDVPPLAVTGDAEGDSGDAITSASLVPLAFTGADVRVLGDPAGGLVVGALLPAEVGFDNVDGDAFSDSTEFLMNARAYAMDAGNGPTALLVTDTVAAGLESELYEALFDAGFYPLAATSAETTTASLAADEAVFVAIENTAEGAIDFEDPFWLTALDGWIDTDGLVVAAAVDLDAAPGLAAALGVAAVADIDAPTAIERDPTHLGRLFSLPETTPDALPAFEAGLADYGDALAAADIGSVAARFSDGEPAIVVTYNGAVITLGFAPQALGQEDGDRNRQVDVQQLLAAALHSVQMPQRSLVLDDGAGPSIFSEAAQRAGLSADLVTDAPSFVSAFDAGEYQQVVIDSSTTDALADADVLDRLTVWTAETRGMTVAFPNFDANPDAAAFFGLVASDAFALDFIVEPSDDTAGLFRSPSLVPHPMQRGASTDPDFGDTFDGSEGIEVGARYRFNLGPIATALTFSGTVAVNGFRPRELQDADLDANGIEDRVSFFANQMIRTGRVPVPAIGGPYTVDEGTSITLDASGSFDPFGENLTFEWDLDLDGDFDDATGPATPFSALGLDGPDVASVAVRISNESGLRAVAPITIDVANVAPAVEAGNDRTVDQGEMASFVATVTDIAEDTFLIDWDFGDGNTDVGDSVMHMYDELGVYDVVVTVEDDDGGVASDAFTVTYQNVAPSVDIGSYEAIDEGDTVDVTAEVSDPGDDPIVVTWDFGDGGTAEGEAASHTYVDDGRFTIAATAADDNDGTRTDTTTIIVRNVAPVITSTAPTTAIAEEEYVYDITVEDPGDDEITYEIEVGPEGMTVNEDGELRWTLDAVGFEDVPVRVVVSDDDGGTTTEEWTIEITFGDRDSGGAPDVCEAAFGFDLDVADDDLSDPDEDGLTVAEECIAGSDPTVFSGPDAPELLAPIGRETISTPFVELLIANTPDPDGDLVTYDFQIFRDAELTDLFHEVLDVAEVASGETPTTVVDEFDEDAEYFWRARGEATDVSGPWSEAETFVFNQRNAPPGRPTAIAPIGYAADNPPTLRVYNAIEPEFEPLVYDFDVFAGQSTREDLLVWRSDPEGIPEGDGGETSVTIDVELEEDREYTWRCRARDPSGGVGPYELVVFAIDAVNSAPPTPEIVGPDSEELLAPSSSVNLQFTNVIDPDDDRVSYLGDVASDEDFTDILRSFRSPGDPANSTTTVIVPVTLEPESTYYWRVAATDERFTSEFAFSSFQTDALFINSAPTTPSPIAPLAGRSYEADEPVELLIDNSTDPDGNPITYTFQIALDVNMRNLVETIADVEEGDDGTTSVVLSDLRSLSYFWRARATDGVDVSAWTEVNGFRVEDDFVFPDVGVDSDAGFSDAGDVGGPDTTTPSGATAGQLGGGGGCTTAPTRSAPALAFLFAAAALILRRRR